MESDGIPDGELKDVANTSFDFRQPKTIAADFLADADQQKVRPDLCRRLAGVAFGIQQEGMIVSLHLLLIGIREEVGGDGFRLAEIKGDYLSRHRGPTLPGEYDQSRLFQPRR